MYLTEVARRIKTISTEGIKPWFVVTINATEPFLHNGIVLGFLQKERMLDDNFIRKWKDHVCDLLWTLED